MSRMFSRTLGVFLACCAVVLIPAPSKAENDAVIAFRAFLTTVAPLAAQDFAGVRGPRDVLGRYSITIALDKKTVDNCFVDDDAYFSLTCDAVGYGPERQAQLESDLGAALSRTFQQVPDLRGMASWRGPNGLVVLLLKPEATSGWMAISIAHLAP